MGDFYFVGKEGGGDERSPSQPAESFDEIEDSTFFAEKTCWESAESAASVRSLPANWEKSYGTTRVRL